MSRLFWMAVGAVGGVATYRKGVQVAARAKELGPLGSAAAVAQGTSRLADRTAHGLSRLAESRDRRAGRLVTGSLAAGAHAAGAPAEPRPAGGIPTDWTPNEDDTKGRKP